MHRVKVDILSKRIVCLEKSTSKAVLEYHMSNLIHGCELASDTFCTYYSKNKSCVLYVSNVKKKRTIILLGDNFIKLCKALYLENKLPNEIFNTFEIVIRKLLKEQIPNIHEYKIMCETNTFNQQKINKRLVPKENRYQY